MTGAQVADYRLKLEAERYQRHQDENSRQILAEAAQFITGTEKVITVKPPIRYKEKEPLKKVWG